jgi:hypothetical protein
MDFDTGIKIRINTAKFTALSQTLNENKTIYIYIEFSTAAETEWM